MQQQQRVLFFFFFFEFFPNCSQSFECGVTATSLNSLQSIVRQSYTRLHRVKFELRFQPQLECDSWGLCSSLWYFTSAFNDRTPKKREFCTSDVSYVYENYFESVVNYIITYWIPFDWDQLNSLTHIQSKLTATVLYLLEYINLTLI